MKRILAILLTICMITSALPVSFAAESESSGNIEYVFSYKAYADENGAQRTGSASNANVLTTTQSAM